MPRLWTLMVPFALALAAQVGFLVHQISVLEPYLGESHAALTVSATTVAAVFGLGVGNLITFPPLLAREEFGPHSFGTVFGLVGAATQAGVARA